MSASWWQPPSPCLVKTRTIWPLITIICLSVTKCLCPLIEWGKALCGSWVASSVSKWINPTLPLIEGKSRAAPNLCVYDLLSCHTQEKTNTHSVPSSYLLLSSLALNSYILVVWASSRFNFHLSLLLCRKLNLIFTFLPCPLLGLESNTKNSFYKLFQFPLMPCLLLWVLFLSCFGFQGFMFQLCHPFIIC